MSKKGSIMDIFIWIIMGIVLLVFFGSMLYAYNEIEEGFMSTDDELIQNATQNTLGQVNSALGPGLHTMAFVIIFVSGISILIHNFLVKAHPAWFITYVFISIVAVIFSVYISNAYTNMLDNEVIGQSLAGFAGANFIMQWLPLFTTVIGLFGAVFLFMGIIRQRSRSVL